MPITYAGAAFLPVVAITPSLITSIAGVEITEDSTRGAAGWQ
jgi:hypothetical protein